MTLFTISVNVKHFFVHLNSAVFKVFVCENRKLFFLCLKHPLFQHYRKNPKWTAMWHSQMVKVAKHALSSKVFPHTCSLKHENCCLDTFNFCRVHVYKAKSLDCEIPVNPTFTHDTQVSVILLCSYLLQKRSHYWKAEYSVSKGQNRGFQKFQKCVIFLSKKTPKQIEIVFFSLKCSSYSFWSCLLKTNVKSEQYLIRYILPKYFFMEFAQKWSLNSKLLVV